jgi:uncharacterized protein (UPF0335 family)
MHQALNEAAASFAQEKQMQKLITLLKLENQRLLDENALLNTKTGEQDSQLKEMVQRLEQAEAELLETRQTLEQERQEHESKVQAFKRIVQNINNAKVVER